MNELKLVTLYSSLFSLVMQSTNHEKKTSSTAIENYDQKYIFLQSNDYERKIHPDPGHFCMDPDLSKINYGSGWSFTLKK